MFRYVVFGAALFTLAPHARAHPGHLAELAGHAHWIGLGAVVAAGLIAAALGGKAKDIQDTAGEDDPSDGEPATESA